jgi:hypothetical protein
MIFKDTAKARVPKNQSMEVEIDRGCKSFVN